MKRRLLSATILAAGAAMLLPSVAAAQFPPPPAPRSPIQERWPTLEPPAPQPRQQQPQQQTQPQEAPRQPAARQAQPQRDTAPDAPSSTPKPAPKPRTASAPSNTVTCGGVFTKDATHLKLAIKYDSRNIVFGEVDGPEGTKIKASILFPNDPRRRLEVIWNNDDARTDLSLVAINGKSQWSAPRGITLGTQLAALEKINGRPFKLSGFAPDGTASVLGWEGGTLTTLPGGCRIGVKFAADLKAVSGLTGDKELRSNDPSLRAAKPTIAEILIGY